MSVHTVDSLDWERILLTPGTSYLCLALWTHGGIARLKSLHTNFKSMRQKALGGAALGIVDVFRLQEIPSVPTRV